MPAHLDRGRSVTSEEIAFIGQLITDRPELSRLCERPTDRPAADPRAAGIRRPAGLDDRPAGERGRQRRLATETAGEVAGGGPPSRDRCFCCFVLDKYCVLFILIMASDGFH